MIWTRHPFLPLAAAVMMTVPAVAHATSPCEGPPRGWAEASVLPADGESDVPIDTWIWVRLEGIAGVYPEERPAAEIAVVDGDGELVATEWAGAARTMYGQFVAFAPVQPLAANQDFAVEILVEDNWDYWYEGDDDDSAGGSAMATSSFTTGSASGADRPAPPTIDRLALHTGPNTLDSGWGCGGYHPPDRADIGLDSEGRVDVVIRLDTSDDSAPGSGLVEVDAAGSGEALIARGRWDPAKKTWFVAGTYDLSGNFSGWSDPVVGTMPAAGCSTDVDLSQASLVLALLLGAGMLGRRLKPNRLFPVLLAGALAAASLTPVTASAADGAVTAETSMPKSQFTFAPGDWRGVLDKELAKSQLIFGGLGLASAGVQVGFAVALPFRAPGALSGTIGNAVAWMPLVTGLSVTSGLRAQLRSGRSARDLKLSMELGFLFTAIGTGVAFAITVPLSIVSGIFLDNSFGVGAALLGAPLSLLSANLTLGVTAARLRKLAPELHKSAVPRRGPQPQLLAAGPTGFVIAF